MFRFLSAFGTIRAMRLSDPQIRTVIAELRERGERVSGAAVRRELAARFGARGGVSRIYRVLCESPPADPSHLEALQQEIAATRERAALAEAREDAHQMHWAGQVDTLRQRVRELAESDHEARRLRAVLERQSIELRAALVRIGRLEEQLEAARAGRYA
jgi:hypothetical protein